ncbi:hypothetical protein [Absidia glauca]|uniref:Integrase catalytic domain-containing protein n=1 Tax=Absidia glauca TaxID=4829 RepID=A0A168LQ53_ABSGL|nr:hypothetical protein [Absidia glauca]
MTVDIFPFLVILTEPHGHFLDYVTLLLTVSSHDTTACPLPTTERNNKYLLVMIDICTRFLILRPLQDKTAESVVQALIPVFCDFGIPTILQSDNGKEFANQVMNRFKIKAGFDHKLITPYYPQGNGPFFVSPWT